jgi:hypothetical protein
LSWKSKSLLLAILRVNSKELQIVDYHSKDKKTVY